MCAFSKFRVITENSQSFVDSLGSENRVGNQATLCLFILLRNLLFLSLAASVEVCLYLFMFLSLIGYCWYFFHTVYYFFSTFCWVFGKGSSVRQFKFAISNQTLGYILEIEFRCLADELI